MAGEFWVHQTRIKVCPISDAWQSEDFTRIALPAIRDRKKLGDKHYT
ncbi:hypothetical protein [Pseudoalteromonas piscicida]|nr:hypothetical protein [Pseudoalteromonas piscicida]